MDNLDFIGNNNNISSHRGKSIKTDTVDREPDKDYPYSKRITKPLL